MRLYSGLRKERFMLALCAFFMIPHIAFAQTNEVLGEVELVGATKVEKTSGVWVDGQYLGYLEELKGTKKILLLPGKHEIIVRQGGYKDVPIEVDRSRFFAWSWKKIPAFRCQPSPPRSS